MGLHPWEPPAKFSYYPHGFDEYYEDEKRKKGFKRMFKMFGAFAVIIVVLAVLWYTVLGVAVVKTAEHVDANGGLKGAVDRVWYGKDGPPKEIKK
jgi:hypothetical protein